MCGSCRGGESSPCLQNTLDELKIEMEMKMENGNLLTNHWSLGIPTGQYTTKLEIKI